MAILSRQVLASTEEPTYQRQILIILVCSPAAEWLASLPDKLMPAEPEAIRLLTRAGRHRPGPYQLQAAIVACHAEAERWQDTD